MTSVAFSLMKESSFSSWTSWLAMSCRRSVSAPCEWSSFCISASYSVLMEEILRCSSFSSFPITSACVFFSAARACCCLFHSCFRLSSFSVFSLFRFFSLLFIPSSSATRLRCSFSNRFILAFRSSLAFFFHSSKSSISCWYWRSNCSSSYSIWLIMAFCSFICGWYLRFNCSCNSSLSVCWRCMAAVISSRRFSPFSFSTI